MVRKEIKGLISLFLLLALQSCNSNPITSPDANMSNPASDYCIQQGNVLEIITAEDGSQSGICIFPNGSSCDEWAFYRGECGPQAQEYSSSDISEVSPTPSIGPDDYQGWWTYTNPIYNFTIMLPEDWVADETTAFDSQLNGHMIRIHPRYNAEYENIRLTFRQVGDETPLWPTGVGQGDFVPQGTLDISGEPVLRIMLVCPTGEITSIWYHQAEGTPQITRGGLEFGLIFSAHSSHCEPSFSLNGKVQRVGEMIIASLDVP
jgi:putative hemolysin